MAEEAKKTEPTIERTWEHSGDVDGASEGNLH